jgi:hypothetical protein
LKLNYDEPLSNVAFNFNLRRYTMGAAIKRVWPSTAHLLCVYHINQNLIDHAAQLFPYKKDEKAKVGRCMLTASKPELKARLVSALRAVKVDSIKTRVESAHGFNA